MKQNKGFTIFELTVVIALIVGVMLLITVVSPKPSNESISGQASQISLGEKEVVIDGCEYFKVPSYGQYYTLTHKGNCKNPIHQR